MYQNISLTEPRLIPQLEKVIKNFIKEIKQQNSEMENLALAIKRWGTQTRTQKQTCIFQIKKEMKSDIDVKQDCGTSLFK